MRAFCINLCLCSLVASSTDCFFEDTGFLQTVAPNRSAVAKLATTVPAVPAASLAKQAPAAKPTLAPVRTPPAKAPPPVNASKRKGTAAKQQAQPKGNKTAGTDDTNETDEADDQLFPADDPNAPEPWQDICVIAGSSTFATLMLCFVWVASLWSASSGESGGSMSRTLVCRMM